MQNSTQKTASRNSIVLLDYLPAEIKKGKDWFVTYHAKNPITGKLERKRNRVPKLKSIRDRENCARKMIVEVNNRLARGWSPFFESKDVFYAKFSHCRDKFLNQCKIDLQMDNKRIDTVRSYNSFFSIFEAYAEKKGLKLDFIIEFNEEILIQYLDYILYDKKCRNRTYNNHLNFFITYCNWLLKRKYIKENFCLRIDKKPKQEKIRTVLDQNAKEKLAVLQHYNFNYYTLMMLTYYCMIRRTEITKLRVSDVDLQNKQIFISSSKSKNRKSECVTITNPLIPLLEKHLLDSSPNDFLFSLNEFKPGEKQLAPKKISDQWAKIRTDLNLPKTSQFYSLKDTGITDLLQGGIASIKVRNQARHHDLKITEMYTPRNITFDQEIANSNISF